MTNLRNRLRWPEAEWDVSGAFAKDAVLLRFYDFCKKRLGYAPFAVVHGSPLFHWNCGRVLSMLLRSDHEINTAAAEYVKRGIPVDLTFTNVNLKEPDMKDVLGNRLLRFFAERSTPDMKHAVIIGSEYPDLELKNMATRESMHASPNGLMAELLGDGEEV